ncbi:hypothetical protein [Aliarcobacter butzleri]|uniref:hypothetical protein n=1 Tax=Aliarcobacter butzleri TaxID=28197 RepID=UPI0024DEBEAA|nr:hypothetical protein [Aliarcobacter butzleri]MDK2080113.1 hypothetical protein [Aliarcobacter butzleri]
MANNKSGFDNEDLIKDALNNKTFEELNDNLKELIKYSFENYNGTIRCEKQAGQNKSDLIIKIGEEKHTYSVKNFGSGHSVHQEKVEDFIAFLDTKYEVSTQIKDDLRFFIWGDKTTTGQGNRSDRMEVKEIVRDYPEKIERLKSFFKPIKKDLIIRFCFEGADCSTHSSEFIYCGDKDSGICCKFENALNWLVENECRGAIPIGRLSLQAWNRAISDGNSENKRGEIQLKWGSLKNDIKKARDE